MAYDPKTDKFPYPEITDKHYLIVKKNDGTVFDKDYPYIDKSKKFLAKQRRTLFVVHTILLVMAKIRLGLRIKGRDNLKKHKDEIDKGIISICNHVHMWDYIAILLGIRPRKSYMLVWAPNVSGESGSLVRAVGGIPIPENDFKATLAYMNAVNDLLVNDHGWLHIYPEGSMWEYYAPIRPFKLGTFQLACRLDKPILPLGISYRKPGWIRRKIFRQTALLNLNIGEPIYQNKNLPEGEREHDLGIRCHDEVCRLAEIDPKENLYEPIFNNSKRVDYYTKEYGKGYKGSK